MGKKKVKVMEESEKPRIHLPRNSLVLTLLTLVGSTDSTEYCPDDFGSHQPLILISYRD